MKIILLGNAGAGKSTMAKKISTTQPIPRLSLDKIAWDAETNRKPIAASVRLLQTFVDQHDNWVVEGGYRDMIEPILPYCDELRFLNPGIDVCVAHCQQRPWAPEKFVSPAAQQANMDNLIAWVQTYETRQDEYGLQRHRALFCAFQGKKREYCSIAEYDK